MEETSSCEQGDPAPHSPLSTSNSHSFFSVPNALRSMSRSLARSMSFGVPKGTGRASATFTARPARRPSSAVGASAFSGSQRSENGSGARHASAGQLGGGRWVLPSHAPTPMLTPMEEDEARMSFASAFLQPQTTLWQGRRACFSNLALAEPNLVILFKSSPPPPPRRTAGGGRRTTAVPEMLAHDNSSSEGGEGRPPMMSVVVTINCLILRIGAYSTSALLSLVKNISTVSAMTTSR